LQHGYWRYATVSDSGSRMSSTVKNNQATRGEIPAIFFLRGCPAWLRPVSFPCTTTKVKRFAAVCPTARRYA
jgi:hypothetical protein